MTSRREYQATKGGSMKMVSEQSRYESAEIALDNYAHVLPQPAF